MKKYTIGMLFAMFVSGTVIASEMSLTPSPEGAKAYIISPANGDTVASTFMVQFGLRGMGVAPAGVEKKSTGHHHLLVDGKLPNLTARMGKQVKHFGGGQTETKLTLTPGQHTLQLVLGDKGHVPHNPPVISDVVTITVK